MRGSIFCSRTLNKVIFEISSSGAGESHNKKLSIKMIWSCFSRYFQFFCWKKELLIFINSISNSILELLRPRVVKISGRCSVLLVDFQFLVPAIFLFLPQIIWPFPVLNFEPFYSSSVLICLSIVVISRFKSCPLFLIWLCFSTFNNFCNYALFNLTSACFYFMVDDV